MVHKLHRYPSCRLSRFAVLLMVMVVTQAHAGIVIFSGNAMMTVPEPKNWVSSSLDGAAQGLNVVLYPRGSSWATSSVAMYARILPKEKRSLTTWVAEDRRRFESTCPGIVIRDIALPQTPSYPSTTLGYDCRRGPNVELVSYLDVGSEFVLWVMSARSAEVLQKNEAAYFAVLHQFKWVDDVKTGD